MNLRNWFFSRVSTLHNLGGLRRGAMMLAAAACLLAMPAMAQVFTVNNTSDPGGSGTPSNCPQTTAPTTSGLGSCTLRDAVAAADAYGSSSNNGDIAFDPALTASGAADLHICDSCGPYQITSYVSIIGPSGANPVEIDGLSADGTTVSMVFKDTGQVFTIQGNIYIMNGAGTGAYPGGAGGGGQAGGVEVDSGIFGAFGVTFMNNLGLSGGGIYNTSSATANLGQTPTITVTNCNFTFNSTGITSTNGTMIVQGSTFFENAPAVYNGNPISGEAGGGIWANNTAVSVTGSTFSNNTNNSNNSNYGPAGAGGAIDLTGSVGVAYIAVQNSTFSYNTASYEGGAAYIGPNLGAWFTNDTFYQNAVQTYPNPITSQGGAAAIFADTNSDLSLLQSTLQDVNASLAAYGGVLAYGNLSEVNGIDFDGGVYAGTLNATGSIYNPATAPISGLGNYGGAMLTMVPLPSGLTVSAAICGGATSNLGNDASGGPISLPQTDERGFGRSITVGGLQCVDVGAVQTQFSVQWLASPSNPQIGGTTITASATPTYPSAQLLDHGMTIAPPGGIINVALTNGTLGGTTSATTNATGVVTLNALTTPHVTTAIAGDQLAAGIYAGPGPGGTTIWNNYDSASFDITDMVLPTTTLAGGTVGTTYSQTINAATGGEGTIAYTVSVGTLPQGLTLNSSTGVISGIPYAATATADSFTLKATDSDGDTATQTYSISIAKATPGVKVTLTAGSNPAFQGNTQTFTATVALGTLGSSVATPSGTVTFYNGSTALCSTVTMAGGTATCTTNALAQGSNVIAASYSGDSNYNTVAYTASTSLTETIMGLTLAPTQMGLTVLPGNSAIYTINVTTTPSGSSSTFPAPATFAVTCTSCTGGTWPAGVTASLSATSLSASGTLTLTIATTQQASLSPSSTGPGMASRYGPLALALLLLPFARRLRRTGRRLSQIGLALLLAVVSLVVAAGVSGCGSTVGFFGQAQKSYTVQVTATSGSYTNNTTVTVTVE